MSDINNILNIFECKLIEGEISEVIPHLLQRTSEYLTNEAFNSYHIETSLMRYLYSLEKKEKI